ncbi:MAG: hypothetical protein Satyrvirus2_14 [Satyrvirus sp.]|uniref:Uncharacterized protein n=1 Tax=Satyrvirus sp. TaxID=2487771 RepID=A0A3G5AGI1_9VIRU|nr:MAG: hypothetical protein Satyrvirus2_14 [Satyrvirus sp.]
MNVSLFLEIKSEYTEHVTDVLTPFIYEGLNSLYKEAVRISKEQNNKERLLMIFQKLLKDIDEWNQSMIVEETNRIKQMSNTSEYFDDLVKAVIKSNIILLSYSNSISNIIAQSFYNSFTTATFVHRCYTECGKDAHNYPFLFYHDVDPMDYKRNQVIIKQNIQQGITRAIRKILPISLILKEYLINSVNIIQEPSKIELIGMQPNPVEKSQQQIPVVKPVEMKIVSEKKIDTKLEKEVMEIIKSENTKTDKQKIQAIMNIEKIITSAEPNKLNEISATRSFMRNSSAKRKSPEILIDANLNDNNNEDDDIFNNALHQSDKKLINTKFDDEKTIESSTKKSVSATSMSLNLAPTKNIAKAGTGFDVSEKVDPNKVDLIEVYESQIGGSKKRKNNK